MMASNAPTVSVLVCTYDRPEYLESCLKSISHQTYKNFELVVVQGPPMGTDTSRTDAILDTVRARVKMSTINIYNVAAARNVALHLAAGDLIALIDDDAVAPANWLQSFVREAQRRDVAGLGGFGRSVDAQIVSRVVTCNRFTEGLNHVTEEVANLRQRPGDERCFSLTGYNALFAREAVLAVGGFDETFAYMFEETDLCFRLMDHGFKLGFSPKTLIVHGLAPGVDRDKDRLPTNLYRRYRSLAYFCRKHAKHDFEVFLQDHAAATREKIRLWVRDGKMARAHANNLCEEIVDGLRDGMALEVCAQAPLITKPPRFLDFGIGR